MLFRSKARENPITRIRVTIAVGERADSAICFQTYLDADIQPEEEHQIVCPVPHVKLQKADTVYIGFDCNVICSHGFGKRDEDATVSWYESHGTFNPLQHYSSGSHKRLYVELYGFVEGSFASDHLLEVAADQDRKSVV